MKPLVFACGGPGYQQPYFGYCCVMRIIVICLLNILMHCLMTRIQSEKHIIRWFHHCVNITECTYINLYGKAYSCNCTWYTFIDWLCSRFVYINITTNRWVMCCDWLSQGNRNFQLHYNVMGPPSYVYMVCQWLKRHYAVHHYVWSSELWKIVGRGYRKLAPRTVLNF